MASFYMCTDYTYFCTPQRKIKNPGFGKMGMIMSLMGGGAMYSQMVSLVSTAVYDRFKASEIKNFDDFHVSILDIFNNFNSALPGKHFDAPPREEIEEAFKQWQEEADPIKKKENFVEFLKRSVKLSKTDNATMITGVMTPPAAMAAKRYIENVPQLKLMKAFPDAVFVPTATVLGLFSVQISRKILMGKMVS